MTAEGKVSHGDTEAPRLARSQRQGDVYVRLTTAKGKPKAADGKERKENEQRKE